MTSGATPAIPDSNPFNSEPAIADSCYTRWDGDQLVNAETGDPAPALADRVHAALRALILDPEFPCVGSRSALNQGSYRFAMYNEMNSAEATQALAHDLFTFTREQPAIEGEFTTFIACFDTPKSVTPEEFEGRLWKQLAALHELDRPHHEWDPSVSSDPDNGRFAFSFAGRAFFVVGLSPQADRWARRFPWPLLALNAHFQFEALREDGRFEAIRDTIRQRDAELEGDANPNAEDFGEHTEARQYSGRPVPAGWQCPVSFD